MTDEHIRKEQLLAILKNRRNLGCHPDLGSPGKLIRFAQKADGSRRHYRVGVEVDGEMRFARVPSETFTKRGLSLSHTALDPGSPVFYITDEKLGTPYGILFLGHPDEVLRLLRLNLLFLQRRSDAESDRLHRELMGVGKDDIAHMPDLCNALVDLKDASPSHFLQLLEEAPDRRVALEAADHGEILSVADRGVASELTAEDARYLASVVRARYMERLQDMLLTGGRLSMLGEKIFGKREAEFSSAERQALLSLAVAAVNETGPHGDSGKSGRFLLR